MVLNSVARVDTLPDQFHRGLGYSEGVLARTILGQYLKLTVWENPWICLINLENNIFINIMTKIKIGNILSHTFEYAISK